MKKRILFGMGAVVALAAPLALAISCSNDDGSSSASMRIGLKYELNTQPLLQIVNDKIDEIERQISREYLHGGMSYQYNDRQYSSSTVRTTTWSGLDHVFTSDKKEFMLDANLRIDYTSFLNDKASNNPFYVVDINSASITLNSQNFIVDTFRSQDETGLNTFKAEIESWIKSFLENITISNNFNYDIISDGSTITRDRMSSIISSKWSDTIQSTINRATSLYTDKLNKDLEKISDCITIENTREQVNAHKPTTASYGSLAPTIAESLSKWEFNETPAHIRSNIFINTPEFGI